MLKRERISKLDKMEKKYSAEEIYNGITHGKIGRFSLGWNLWLGISIAFVMFIWMAIYASRLLTIAHKLKNDDNLMKEIKFDEQLTIYGHNLGGLSLSILAFCKMESSPTLHNIAIRLGLSNQILKQRYMVRNSIEKLNEIKYPKNKLDTKPVIEEIIENTTTLLQELVPLNFVFEDQPSPISPAPPPFYVPYRTNITEEEIKNSTESDSTTFLAAKYLCNNTEYISEISDSLKNKALNISNPAKLFDLRYLNEYFRQNDIIKFQSTSRMLIFHYLVVTFVTIMTLIIFYFGSNDYFQKKKRLKMMNICKKQIIDIFNQIINVDKANKALIVNKFRPVLVIFENLKHVCDGIVMDYSKDVHNNDVIFSLEILSSVIQEFQNCVGLAQKFCDILDNEINQSKKAINEPIKVHEVIEQEIQNSNITNNSHHFSDNVPNEIYLHSGKHEFNEVINSMLNVLSPNVDKAIFWDIIQVGDHSLIPASMVNSIGEVSTGVKQVIEDNWNLISSFKEESREYSFLTIDISPAVISKNMQDEKKGEELKVNDEKERYEMNYLLEALICVTRSFHLLVAKRMASCVFGGILISHGNFGDPGGNFQVNELNYVRDITGNTLIIPIKKNQKNYLNSNLLVKSLSQTVSPNLKIYTSGLDFKVVAIIKNISKILKVQYLEIECWELREKDNLVDYLLDKPGYWLIDTSIIHLIESQSKHIINLCSQKYYLDNNIDVILLNTFEKVEVVSEYNNDINLNQFYYSLKYFISGKTFPIKQSPSKTHIGQENKIHCNYKQIIRLLNRPISEINENLFRDIEDVSQISVKDDSLIGSSFLKLVDIRELYLKQKSNKKDSEKLKSIKDEDWEIRRPEIFFKEWYNIDLLELSIDEIKEIASFLIYYRFREVIRDKDDYEEDVLSWPINQRKIKNFVSELIKYYHEENPFHNFHHVVSISITLNNWLDKPCVRHYVNSLEAYCLIISSLSHDLDHPGLTNDMIKELKIISRKVLKEFVTEKEFFEYLQNNTLSTLGIYNDFSVLENHHSSLLFVILNDESSNIMPPSNSKHYSKLRKMMINSILLTDMFHHKYLRNLISSFNESCHSNSNNIKMEEHRKKLYLSILLHSADISNPLMNTNIYLKWSRLVYEELENQKKLKLMLNIPINDTTDTYDYNQLQTNFIGSICIPYFQALLKFDPELVQECIQNLYFNRDYFVRISQKHEKK
ncbi:cyclic nucleotide phosphodiesterase domain-containing [Cryptosporidium sp. chipmunk genotype I]|uniref:cyclic nucleotide phosphodiesterase domain-containing n=1 Tax=Cryptosporidium sp. chipmunk genotype I TaxID=1280935 RepID=UPI00351A410D|nr:cyclic nucleotide phosphodiesterase domain-containing [Cryptosporidium sp. chipmunk genotype I]